MYTYLMQKKVKMFGGKFNFFSLICLKILFFQACGQSYHLTEGFSLSAALHLPPVFINGDQYFIGGSCSPNGSTVEISSPDMNPSMVTAVCVNGQFQAVAPVTFNATGPNGASPVLEVSVVNADGNSDTSTGVGQVVNGNPNVSLISSVLSGPTNASSIPISIAFDKDMDLSTIALSDFVIGNGVASNLSCSGSPTVCTIDVAPSSDGNVTVDLAANQADDLAGNGNNVAVQFVIESDTTAPPSAPITASTMPGSPTTDPNADLNIDCGVASANGTVVVTTNPANGFTPNYGTTEALDANGQLSLTAVTWSSGTYDILLACSDAAGNGPSSPTTPPSIIVDNAPPSAVISSTATGPTNTNPIPVTIAFDEDMDVSSIALSDFTIGNGVASNLSCSGSPTVCTMDVAPSSDGNVTVDLAANQADDLAGNGNNVAVQFVIESDTTAPPSAPITASTTPGSPTTDTGADLLVDCGVTSANGTVVVTTNPANGFTPNYGTTETLDANGQLSLTAVTWSPGTYDILLACSDAAGNGPSSPATPPSITIDNGFPNAVISSTETGPSNANPIPISVAFDTDMDLSTLVLSDFVVGNGVASNLSCSGSPTVCTMDVAPSSDGNVTVDLAANQADDLAGNGNNVAVQFVIESDTTAPPSAPITASTTPGSPTTDTGADLLVDCGVASANGTVVVTTNPANGFTPNYGTTETLDANGQLNLTAITWTSGTYDILLACSDAAGNGPSAPTTPPSITVDNAPPSAVISSTATGPTNANPIPVTITFDEDMDASTLALSDFVVGNGVASNLSCSGSPTVCTMDVAPSSDGNVTVDLAANQADDLAGNGNNVAAQFVIESDTMAPPSAPITASTTPGSPTTDLNADLNIDCGIASANGTVVVTTNPANGFTPNYGTTETLDANGQLSLTAVTWSPGTYDILLACSDAAGNGPSSPTTPPSITVDNAPPSAVISSTATGPTNANPIPVIITFDEDMDVSSIALSDFTIGNGVASNLNCSGSPTVCTMDVAPSSDGNVTVDLAANQADDLAGNGNNVAAQFVIESDTTAPPSAPITASTTPGSPTTDTGADLLVDCGVTSANGTVVVTTNPANGFTPNYGTTETLDANGQLNLTAVTWSPGTYDILLACSDAAGNGPSSPTTPPSITVDNAPPSAVISSTATGPTNTNPIPVTITFDEDMDASTIALSDFTVGNGVASNLSCSGSPTVCTMDVAPSSDGNVTVDLAANQADDLAGNGNNVAVQFVIESDTTAPPSAPITASTTPGSPTTDVGADLLVDCGVASANGTVVVTTNPANGFTPNYGTTETLDANGQLNLTAVTWSPGTYDILLACSDAAGNGPSSPTTPPSITVDNAPPSVVISSTETGPSNANPIPVTITFDEDMDASTIALSDFTIGNGVASNLNCSGSPTVCTMDVAPSSDGNVTVDLAANQADDLAGNGNNVAVQFVIESDTTAPPSAPITASTTPGSPTTDLNADLNIDCGVASANGTVVVTTNPANGFTPNYGTTETLDANGQLSLTAVTWSSGTYDILLACSDAAGNGPSSPTTPPSITVDNAPPSAVISSTATGPTNTNPIPVTITFDEDMDASTIALSDFTVGNGVASNLSCSGSPTVCTMDVAPSSDGNVTVDLAANQADDLAGNGNNVAAQFSILFQSCTPSNIVAETEVHPSDGAAFDAFGVSVAFSSHRFVVSAPSKLSSTGKVYIFDYDTCAGTWSEQGLTASNASTSSYYGGSVDIADSGDLIVVGAPDEDTAANNAGMAYVYNFNSSTSNWDETILRASDEAVNYNFGDAVTVSPDGNTILVGARRAGSNGEGAVYIFEYNSGTGNWDENHILTPSDGDVFDFFGTSVALSGNRIVVGASHEDGPTGATPWLQVTGALYVFEYNTGSSSWVETAKLEASNETGGAGLGMAVDIDGDRILAGAPSSSAYQSNGGAAYFWDYNTSTSSWDETPIVAPPGAAGGDAFGASVSLDGDHAAVGSTSFEENTGPPERIHSGAVFYYEKIGASWMETKVDSSDQAFGDYLGRSVALDTNYIVSGAISDDDGVVDGGSFYVFPRP